MPAVSTSLSLPARESWANCLRRTVLAGVLLLIPGLVACEGGGAEDCDCEAECEKRLEAEGVAESSESSTAVGGAVGRLSDTKTLTKREKKVVDRIGEKTHVVVDGEKLELNREETVHIIRLLDARKKLDTVVEIEKIERVEQDESREVKTLAAQEEADEDDDDDDGGKVTICHVPPGNPANEHTIRVGAPAVDAHLGHGDYKGECDGRNADKAKGRGNSGKARGKGRSGKSKKGGKGKGGKGKGGKGKGGKGKGGTKL